MTNMKSGYIKILSLTFTIVFGSCSGIEGAVNKTKTLYIGGIFAMTSAGWPGGLGTLPAVQIAFDLVNNRSDILPDHRLELTWTNSRGISSVGVKYLFEIINSPKKRIMLIGPVLSRVAVAVADVAQHWNLMQFGFAARTAVMNDRARFPFSYRTLPDDSLYNPVRIKLFQKFGWKRIATLHLNRLGDAFSSVTQELIDMMEGENMTLVTRESFSDTDGIITALQNLKKADARIIVGSIGTGKDIPTICEIYKQGLYGPKYVWILLGWVTTHKNFPRYGEARAGCTEEQVKAVLEGHFVINFYGFGRNHQRQRVFDMTPDDFDQRYRNIALTPDHADYEYGPFAFDAALTIAHVLNQSRDLLNGSDLVDFTYDDVEMRKIFQTVTNGLAFNGLTGPVAFDSNGNRVGLQTLERYQNGQMDIVGIYYPGNNSIVFDMNKKIIWKDDRIPADGMSYRIRFMDIPREVQGTISGLAIFGILLALTFLAMNINKRKLKFIKLSSPNLNNIIIAGCVLVYVSVILAGIDGPAVDEDGKMVSCTLRLWTLCIGFTAAFGAMFAKTWRVHVVMTTKSTKKMQRRPVQDIHLVVLILLLLSIDFIILIIWITVDPYYIRKASFPDAIDPVDSNIAYSQYRMMCTSNFEVYWLGAVYIYKAIIMLLGLFLAWETRQVRIPALNDSKFIGMCVYNVVLLSVIGAPTGHVMGDDYFVTAYVITSVLIIFCTTITLGLVFVPKLRELQVNPDGNVVVTVGTVNNSVCTTQPSIDGNSIVANAQQHAMMAQKDKLIAELMRENASLKESSSVSKDNSLTQA